jgi:hypothetical protein
VKDVADPPTLPSNKITDYKSYVKTINYFMDKDNSAVDIALKDCVDLSSKLAMFMCYRGDKILQDGIVDSLVKLVNAHPYSCKIIKDFLSTHGDNEHKISKTTVRNEIKRFEVLAKLLDVQ